MGGFVLDTDDPDDEEYILGSPRLILTVAGVVDICQLGFLPDISLEHIKDKSKQDAFAKGLAIVQSCWLIVQCIQRAAAHLPLSCLEVNTLAHVACALALYVCWWKKPLDIHEPTLLRGEWVRPLCAVIWMNDFRESPTPDGKISYAERKPQLFRGRRGHIQRYMNSTKQREDRAESQIILVPNKSEKLEQWMLDTASKISEIGILDPQQAGTTLVTFDVFEKKISARSIPKDGFISVKSTTILSCGGLVLIPEMCQNHEIFVSKISLRRWLLVKEAATSYPQFLKTHVADSPGPPYNRALDLMQATTIPKNILPTKYKRLTWVPQRIRTRCGNSILELRQSSTTSSLLGGGSMFITCAFLYGGINAASWNEHFPTPAERLLWRISSLLVMCAAIVLVLIFFVVGLMSVGIDEISGKCRESRKTLTRQICRIWEEFYPLIIGILVIAICIFYLAARFYLVVEAFIGLRELPVEVYRTSNWIEYLLHF
jgi:hypothetical protein